MPLNFGQTFGGSIRNWLSFIQLAPGFREPPKRRTSMARRAVHSKSISRDRMSPRPTTRSGPARWPPPRSRRSASSPSRPTTSPAEFGQVLGGVFNFTTKSGTNEFHGSVYEFLTNEALSARNPSQLHSPPVRARRKRSTASTIMGLASAAPSAPWLYDGRNKTFFFFSLEKYRNVCVHRGTWRPCRRRLIGRAISAPL